MEYMCENCKKVVDETEVPTIENDIGYATEVGYIPLKEILVDYCECGGEFVPAIKCKLCEKYIEKLGPCVCEKCVRECFTFENAVEFGKENKENREINGYISSEFTTEQIESILLKELTKRRQKKFADYCECDFYMFAEWVEKNN